MPTTQTEPAAKPEPFATWTIYDHPSDYPHAYVARKWLVVAGNPEPQPAPGVLTHPDLGVLRALLPPGLTMLPRQPGDDPVILETWF